MAIKTFTFSFKLDAKDLLEYVTERNVGVDIQAFGTEPKQPKLLTGPKMLALPAPRKNGRPGIQQAIIAFLIQHKEGVSSPGLKALLGQTGYSEKSLSNQLWTLRQNGLVRNVGKKGHGLYQPTAKALREANHG